MDEQTNTRRPTEHRWDAKLLAEIERQPGQTMFGLQARFKIGTGPAERALRRLVDARLVGIQRDERGKARYVSLEQWIRGVDAPGERRADR